MGNICTWPNVTQHNFAPRCSIVALGGKAAEDPCWCRLTSCVRSLMLNNTERRGNQSCSEHDSGKARGRLHCHPFHYFERLTLDWLLKINRATRVQQARAIAHISHARKHWWCIWIFCWGTCNKLIIFEYFIHLSGWNFLDLDLITWQQRPISIGALLDDRWSLAFSGCRLHSSFCLIKMYQVGCFVWISTSASHSH